MPFSSFNFILLVPFLVLSFWMMPRQLQKPWLLALSVLVYLAAGWQDLALLFGAVLVNWAVPKFSRDLQRACGLMVALDVAFLAYFKYRVFLANPGGWAHPGAVVIPLGISFYAFQLIAYQIELRRGELAEQPPFGDFLLYILFFPHHQAGPIMRPHAFLRCFEMARTFYASRFTSGVLIFLWGLAKKVWIADLAAPSANQLFGKLELGQLGVNLPLLGVLYGIQIYADFSGYSDMAVGLGRLFGFKFDRNFHQPYLASGPSEFWRRWHVTLSQWLRDFIYLPLGGNRKGRARTLVNLMAVMVLGGLWHGAGWNFVAWGALHGLLLVAGRLSPRRLLSLPRWVRVAAFQGAVAMTWLPFRESDLGALGRALAQPGSILGPGLGTAALLLALAILFSLLEERLEGAFTALLRRCARMPLPLLATGYGAAFWAVLVGAGHATTFIYQRF